LDCNKIFTSELEADVKQDFVPTKVRWQKKFKKIIAHNVFGLGEVAFVRWLVCRKAILPNPCYTLFVLIFCAVGINH
jgi:hypothetical protein